jgi:hypothetical protein
MQLASLGRRFARLVGPLSLSGFPEEGKFNLEVLAPGDEEYGQLDGLAYQSLDGRAALIATTRPILQHWLHEEDRDVPKDVAAALSSEGLYSFSGISGDTAAFFFATLPVTPPKGADAAVAFLALESQDDPLWAPDHLKASVVSGDRVYLLSEELAGKMAVPKECAGPVDSLLNDHGSRKPEDADRIAKEFQRCFAARFPQQPEFQPTLRQAQTLVDRVAAGG